MLEEKRGGNARVERRSELREVFKREVVERWMGKRDLSCEDLRRRII